LGTIVKITAIGDALGIILPEDALVKLGAQEGDTLYITETPNGLELCPWDEQLGRKVEIGRRVARKYRDALRDPK